jgi:glucan phosphoethanolaminetransferase (alkaline phosphatase superfamily)
MIAAATQKTAWLSGLHLGFTAFDAILVVFIAVGFWRGRRNGMTKEWLPFLQWLVLVAACTLGYNPLSGVLVHAGVIHQVFGTTFKESTTAAVAAYLIIACVVFLVFAQLKNTFRERVEGSNAFGNSEYYLGMFAGSFRYTCMMIFFLALLNAPVYTLADIQHRIEFNNATFAGGFQGGGGFKSFDGDFIPSLDEIQAAVFKDSLAGPAIKKNLSLLLINPDGSAIQQATAQKKPVIHMGD